MQSIPPTRENPDAPALVDICATDFSLEDQSLRKSVQSCTCSTVWVSLGGEFFRVHQSLLIFALDFFFTTRPSIKMDSIFEPCGLPSNLASA